MKKLLVSFALMCMTLGAFAQDFYPDWYLSVKGGVGETVGETSFKDLLSPQAALSLGYQFTPVFGLRGDLSGWNGKGVVGHDEVYKFNDAQLALDATFDLCNLFAGYKARTLNPYVFAGLGANVAFNNDEAQALRQWFHETDNLWDGTHFEPVGRLGAGLDIRLSETVAIELEVVENAFTDKFNSKVGDVLDHQINALAGLKFSFGAAKRRAAEAAALAAAEAAAAKAAAEKAAAELAAKQAAERAAAERAAREAAEREAAARAAAERAAAERAAARATTENVLFIIGQWNIRPSEQQKVDNIISIMKAYPEAVVTVTGYADKQTGTSKRNMYLSQKRAEEVTNALVNAGIDKSRINTEFRGSEENPFATPAENRVAVCVTR